MSFSVRLESIKCIEESGEVSTAEEPYVLVTSCSLAPPPADPRVTTFLYGPWPHFDDGEIVTLIGERPFWYPLSEPWEPRDINDPDHVCFIVSVMEEDDTGANMYRGIAQAAATVAVAESLGLSPSARLQRTMDGIRGAIDLAGGSSIVNDHVETKELRLDWTDIGIPAGTSKDKKVNFEGSGSKWELTFRIVHHERVAFIPGARLAAVARDSDKMEVWCVDTSGTLRGNWFHGRWHGWYRLGGETFPVAAHLAAVNRHGDHMEVWAVGHDGIVRGTWFNGSKWEPWYALPGATFQPGSALAAVSRHPDRMEIWGVDTDGSVRGRFFDGGWDRPDPEPDWYTLGGATFPQGVHIVATTRGEHHMQVWAVGDDRPILGNRFDGSIWMGWEALGNQMFSPGTRLAAVTRRDLSHVHLLAVDMNQHVGDFWYDNDTPRGWYQAGIETFSQGTPLAGISRNPALMECWAAAQFGGPNALMRSNLHVGSGWTGWNGLGGPNFPPLAHLAAATMHGDHVEIWGASYNGVEGISFRDGAWQRWYQLRWSAVD